jgi:hypothetical protein
MEFRKAGYEVVIPKQEKPWCLHDSGLVKIESDIRKRRKSFVRFMANNII